MSYSPDIHQRRSIRLKGYDYATPGAYFVTICTHERSKHKGLLSEDKPGSSSLGHFYFQSHNSGTIPVDPPDDAKDGGGISGPCEPGRTVH
jgi:hypothetical protein